MRIFSIIDKEGRRKTTLGYLLCYEKAKQFVVELDSNLDEWTAPVLFQGLVKRGIYTIPSDISRLWVQERVIPSGRQNIGDILRNAHLKEYDELALLALSKGKCSQDNCYLAEISEKELPEEIQERRKKNVKDCCVIADGKLLCMYYDEVVQKVDPVDLVAYHSQVGHVLKNEALLRSVRVGVGGYGITFNESIAVATADLRAVGVDVGIRQSDVCCMLESLVIDTTTACNRLGCSRQALAYWVKLQKLKPIILGTKENLYLVSEIERLRNE